MRTWFTAAVLTLAAAMAAAPSASADRGDRRGPRVADRDGARDKARQKIKALRAMILVQELGLDEATAGRLAPVLDRHDEELGRLIAERRALRKQLRAAREGGQDAKLDGLIDQLIANQRARWAREEARFAEVRKLLTPRQAARLVEVLPQIDRRILQGLRRAVAADGLDDEDGGDDAADDAPPPPRRGKMRRR